MSNLSKDDVLKLAKLARLKLSDDEVQRYQKEFTALLDYVEQLSSVDTDSLSPTYQVTGLQTVTRPDVEIDYGVEQAGLLSNVQETKDGQIKVQRMLG